MSDELLDDGKQNMEAHNKRQEQTKEIETMGFDQEQYEAIESEFREFLNDHLKGKDLEKFKQEYTKINKMLKSSYQDEKRLIKKCKELISEIFDKSSNYRAALRMANNEQEKIKELKDEMNKSHQEVNNIKEDEEHIRQDIQNVKTDINNLKRIQQQTSELPEDQELRKLIGEYEQLYKEKEEQDDLVEGMKYKNNELEETRVQNEADIVKQIDNIDYVRNQIDDTKKRVIDKEKQKEDLEEETKRLREEIISQKQESEEKKQDSIDAKGKNKAGKQDIEFIEKQIQE